MKKNEQGYILCFKEGIDTTKPDYLQKFERKERWMSPAFVNNKTMLAEMGWKVVEDEMPVLAPSIAFEGVKDSTKEIFKAFDSKEIPDEFPDEGVITIAESLIPISERDLQPEQNNNINEPINEKVKRPRIKKPKKRAYNRKPKTEIAHAD